MKKIVLLVDPPRKIEYVNLARHDLEGYTPLEVSKMQSAIALFTQVTLYTDTEKFMKKLWMHKRHLIFPMIWGRGGRNTKAILPAVCEARGIPYIGPDSYTQILCYDKFLSKKYAQAFKFKTPNGLMLFDSQDEHKLNDMLRLLRLPIIIKPNFGGGSCGISENNLVDTYDDALKLVKELFANQYSPLLAEEYIQGNEISILLLGNHDKIHYCGETQLIINGETFFEHKIWGFEEKKLNFLQSHYQVCSILPEHDLDRAKRLFLSFPKAEYLRIDGRFDGENFYVLELSADCYLGPNCDFSVLLEAQGKTYADFLKLLAENALSAHF